MRRPRAFPSVTRRVQFAWWPARTAWLGLAALACAAVGSVALYAWIYADSACRCG